MHRTARNALLIGSGALAALVAIGGTATAGGRPFAMALSGAQEVPANVHGHDDRGSVAVSLNQGQEEICFTLGAITLRSGEALPTAGHIHRAPAGVAGPVVVPLFGAGTAPTSYPTAERCVPAARDLVKEIRQNPGRFYVNLHNPSHPSGVVRGQLSGPGT
ncbi:MAG: CHRD domain-containing protein [Acidimicrobiales bacterium]